jgi:flagellum-specific peptidoglycan hydrolase FlgJ
MKTLIHPEQLAEWKKAADCAANRPDHMNHVALGVMAAEAIPALIADLEDANASLEAEELMSKTLRHHLMSREAELSGVRKQLSEVQSSKAQWKANHDSSCERTETRPESREAEEARRKERAKWKAIRTAFGKGEETFLDRMEIHALLKSKTE